MLGRCAGEGLRSTRGAGGGEGKGAEGRAGVARREGRSWWSIEFDQSISDWLGRCLYPHSRAAAGGRGCSRRLMRVACVLCGACSGHLSVVSRAALRPTRILLFRYYGIDTRAAACHPVKGNGRRRRSAPRPFGHFGPHAQPSCTAPECDRGSAWGRVGWWRSVGDAVMGGAAHIGVVGEAARAVTRPEQPHACTAAPVKREDGVFPGGEGREHGEARGGKGM